MKKFALLTIGFKKPTPEQMEEWMSWFESIGDQMVEQVGLMNGRKVTPSGVEPLVMDLEAITGYLVLEAETMDEALAIAQKCPMVTSTLVYELRSH